MRDTEYGALNKLRDNGVSNVPVVIEIGGIEELFLAVSPVRNRKFALIDFFDYHHNNINEYRLQ